MPEPELDRLSNILKAVQRPCSGTSSGRTRDRIRQADHRGDPAKVAADQAYQNAQKNSDKQNARIEHDKALAG